MKLRNIFTMLAAALAFAFVGCQEEERFLEEVQVSQSFVAIPVTGSTVEVTVDAAADWAIAGVPEWLTVSPATGGAGKTVVSFTAAATTATNEAILELTCAGETQLITVLQMAEKMEIPLSTCAQVNAGEDGVIYRVKGAVTSIANTQYGNWYLQDETGSVYIYGTLYEGATQQFTKLGLEVGDIVTVEGPRKDYNGTIELVDVTVIEIEKSLIKVEEVAPETSTLPLEGGEFAVTLTAKGDGVKVSVPEEAQSWVSVTGVSTSGTTSVVTFNVAKNEGGAREVELSFTTSSKGVDYTVTAALKQEGSIVDVTVEEFLAKEVGTALFRLTGKVGKIANTTYGNFDLIDATGTVYVYGLTDNGAIGSNDKTFESLGIKEGDIVTIVGTRAEYKGTAQVGGTAYLVKHETYTEATVAEFIAKEVGDAWYKLSGTVTNLATGNYGNFDLVDETGTVYVYGLTVAPVAKNDQSFPKLGIKEGDKVTLIGKRAEYKGTIQVGGPAYYISHVEGTTADDNTGNEEGDDVVEAENYSVSFADVANRTVFTKDQQVWAQNGVTVTNDKASSTNDVADYSNPARFYKGSSLTVAFKGMKKIEFICNDYKETYPTDLNASISDSNATVAVDGTKVTVTFANAVDTFTVATLAGQVRMNSLTVYTK